MMRTLQSRRAADFTSNHNNTNTTDGTNSKCSNISSHAADSSNKVNKGKVGTEMKPNKIKGVSESSILPLQDKSAGSNSKEENKKKIKNDKKYNKNADGAKSVRDSIASKAALKTESILSQVRQIKDENAANDRRLMLAALGIPADVVLPAFVNYMEIQEISQEEALMGPSFNMKSKVLPRIKNVAGSVSKKKIWQPGDSIFFPEFKNHDERHMMLCFVKDWRKTKAFKISLVNNDLNTRLETLLRQYWKLLKNIHVHYSCLYSSETFFMGSGAFNEFLTACCILDSQDLGNSSIPETPESAENNPLSMNSLSKVAGFVSKIKQPLLPQAQSGASRRPSVAVSAARRRSTLNPSKFKSQNQEGGVVDAGRGSETPPTSTSTPTSTSIPTPTPTPTPTSSVKQTRNTGCNRTEAEMIFISASISGERHANNTKRTLSRDQFIDTVVSLAMQKYLKTRICADMVQATQKLIEEHLVPYAERDDVEEFRNTILITEPVDTAIRENFEGIKAIYKAFSGGDAVGSEVKTMSLLEWTSLCNLSNILNELPGITERIFKLSYSRAKSPCAEPFSDENTIKKMTLYEFAEAIVRLAYAVSQQLLIEAEAVGKAQKATGEEDDTISNLARSLKATPKGMKYLNTSIGTLCPALTV